MDRCVLCSLHLEIYFEEVDNDEKAALLFCHLNRRPIDDHTLKIPLEAVLGLDAGRKDYILLNREAGGGERVHQSCISPFHQAVPVFRRHCKKRDAGAARLY